MVGLHPDVIAITEYHNDPRTPFSAAMVDRAFELNSLMQFTNDLFCRPPDDASGSHSMPTVAPTSTEAVGASPLAVVLPSRLDGMQKQVSDSIRDAAGHFSSRFLSREDMLVVERFVWMRSVLGVVALPEALRFLRPRWHHEWRTLLLAHGLQPSPVAPAVVQALVDGARGYQGFLQVKAEEAEGAAVMHICGRPVFCTSVWTVGTE